MPDTVLPPLEYNLITTIENTTQSNEESAGSPGWLSALSRKTHQQSLAMSINNNTNIAF